MAAVLLFAGCGGQSLRGKDRGETRDREEGSALAREPISEFPLSLARPSAFVSSPRGLVPYEGGLPPEGGRILLTASEKGRPAILAVIGGYGIVLIEPSPEEASFRLRAFPSSHFSGLDPGGAWPESGGFLVQLFRNPLMPALASVSGPRLFAFGEARLEALSPEAFSSSAGLSEELFAFFPDPRKPGAWLTQLRSSEAGDSVTSRFLALDSLIAPSRPLDREAFESILRPRPLAPGVKAGGISQELFDALGAEALRIGGGDFILRLRAAEGSESYWAKGSADLALALEAWASRSAGFLLGSEGRASFFGGAGAGRRELKLEPPLPGAEFGTVAFLPLAEGFLVAAAWEAKTGTASGLLVFRLGASR